MKYNWARNCTGCLSGCRDDEYCEMGGQAKENVRIIFFNFAKFEELFS